ncbi:hypothetical protein ACFVVM_33065 [Nocardia sp. NPDC058176]|uniref:hypothetical protein n=1 Tax=Nocardia sp. NPDC058176 TaxID=3346368 RepID=UPI0036DAE0E3
MYATEIASNLLITDTATDYTTLPTGEVTIDLADEGRIVIGDDADGLTWTRYGADGTEIGTDGVEDSGQVTAENVLDILGLNHA